MLHPAEGPGVATNGLIVYQSLDGTDGRHIILHVVDAGEKDVLQRQHGTALRSVPVPDGPDLEEASPLRHMEGIPGKPFHPARGLLRQLPGQVVVPVGHQPVSGPLVGEDVGLGRHILRHVGVDVQVVGGQVGKDRHRGAAVHGHELEGAELHHRQILPADVPRLVEEGVADVAPQVDGAARRPEEPGDDSGGGGLSVTAGDSNDGTGTDLEEHLHLRGNLAPPPPGGLQVFRVQARGAEDHVGLEVLQVVRPQAQGAAHGLQLLRQRTQGLPVLLIAGGDGDPRPPQQTDQGRVAHPHADDGHRFSCQCAQILLQGHMPSPPSHAVLIRVIIAPQRQDDKHILPGGLRTFVDNRPELL